MWKVILLLLAVAAALFTPANAQDNRGNPPVTQKSSLTSYDTNAIIVTATRRASPLSDVPIAVSAVTGDSLRNSGASDIRQLNQLAPSLLVSSSGTESNGAARLRGLGTVAANPGLERSLPVLPRPDERRVGTGVVRQ